MTIMTLSTRSIHSFELFPLHRAVQHGDVKKTIELIQRETDVDQKNFFHGDTPLHCAAQENKKLIAELLMLNGAQPNVRNNFFGNHDTPLHCAVRCNCYDTAKALLDHGADVNVQNNTYDCHHTPLHIAAKNGNAHIVSLLLAQAADPNIQNKNGNNALHFASYSNNMKTVRLLVAYNAEIDLLNNFRLYALRLTQNQGIIHFMRKTYQQNLRVMLTMNNQDRQQCIDDGAQSAIVFEHANEQYKQNLLHDFRIYAYLYNQQKLRYILHVYDIPQVWFFYAIYSSHADILEIVCIQKRDQNKIASIRTKKIRNTLLHFAVAYNRIDCAAILLRYIHPMLTNNQGKTAYEIAKEHHKKPIGKMIARWNTINSILQQPKCAFIAKKSQQLYEIQLPGLPPEITEIIAQYAMPPLNI
jgi:ankyrin repeat protein